MAYNGFAIDEYLDAAAVTRQLDELIQKPVWSIRRDKLADYVQHYFEEKCPRSKEMISQAKKVIPGGVQHNLAFNYPFPIVVTRAEGAKLYDIDGNWYYDLLQAGGPTILGSNPPAVRDQVIELLKTCGPSTGLFHEFEYKLAKKISDLVPSVEMFRMLGSGTEADMVAVRIARLKTDALSQSKMGGAYHGWSDQLAYGIRVPGTKGLLSKGVPGYVFKHTDEFFPNDLEDLERKLRANRLTGGTAAVFLEPMGPESGTRPLSREFVRGAAKLARDYGALLVFDEVVTGFRIGLSGAQGYFGVDPDLTVFGKIIAGGLPRRRRRGWPRRLHGPPGGRSGLLRQEGIQGHVRRHHGRHPHLLRGGVLRPVRDRAHQRLRGGRADGGPADPGPPGPDQKVRPALRGLQPGVYLPSGQRGHHALLHRLVQATRYLRVSSRRPASGRRRWSTWGPPTWPRVSSPWRVPGSTPAPPTPRR